MSTIPNNYFLPSNIARTTQALNSFLFPEKSNLSESRCATTPANSPPLFQLSESVGTERAIAERFISQRFAESFGSRVEGFMPRLFTLRNQEGEICGAFGLRSANQRLFLEQYLDVPIEKIITALTGNVVVRRAVIEVGHFAGTFPGAVRTMIELLTERLHREDFSWVAFTGTSSLRNAFCRLGLSPLDIQIAKADRLPVPQRAAWGNYYDHAPRVLVGNIREGYQAIRSKSPNPRLAKEGKA
jgi:hypothetical protein